MKMDKEGRILWVDILTFKSLYHIFQHRRVFSTVIYLNVHKFVKPFFGFFSLFLPNTNISQLSNIIEPDLILDKVSLYESIHCCINFSLNAWVNEPSFTKEINNFTIRSKFCSKKFKEHIKEASYFLIFRPVEILKISESLGLSHRSSFLLKSSSVQGLVQSIYSKYDVKFYVFNTYFPSTILQRKNFLQDFHLYEYTNFIRHPVILAIKWTISLLGKLVSMLQKKDYDKTPKIGVELIQDKFRMDKNNDLYWLNKSGIDPVNIQGISLVNYDSESIHQLTSSGINICIPAEIIARNPVSLIKNLNYFTICSPDINYFFNTFFLLLKMILLLPFKGRDKRWFFYLKIQYTIRVKYWESIYNRVNMRLFFSMTDIDSEKLIKIQAIENNNGVSFGSHWSAFPMYSVINQKCSDIIFSWGELFSENIFSKRLGSKCIDVGYISDYLFNYNSDIGNSNEFAITYFDNSVGNDAPHSIGMQIDIYKILVKVLNNNSNAVLYLKPKKYVEMNDIEMSVPGLNKLINIGRVKLFINDKGERISPHSVGMSSDLVIGLGISTAAAECCFAGTVSFHADLTGFVNNDFANNSLGKVVFRDVSDLELAIENQISGKGISIEECRELHRCLDPYQDGKAYLRVGSVLKQVQQNLGLGMSRKDAIEKVKLN